MIFKSTLVISFFSVLSRISGYIRDVFFANFLGTGIYNDIFQACFRIPNFFRVIIVEGNTNLAFVPLFKSFEKNKDSHIEDKRKFSSNLFFLILLFLLPLFLLIEIFMPQVINLITPGFKNLESFELVISVSRIVFPYSIFIIISSILIGILNSDSKFTITSSIHILFNIIICFTLYAYGGDKIDSIIAISWSCIVSGILQFIILFFAIDKKLRIFLLIPKFTQEIKKFLLVLFPSFLIFFIFQINKFFVYYLASYEVGAISYIYFAERVSQLPMGIISLSITTAMLPIISSYIQKKNLTEAKIYFEKAFQYIMFFMIPSAFVFYFYSEIFISSLFEHGQFTKQSTNNTSNVLEIFSIGLPAYACIPLFTQLFILNNKIKLYLVINIVISITSLLVMTHLSKINNYLGISQGLVFSYWALFITVVIYLIYTKFIFLKLKVLYSILSMIFSSVIMIGSIKLFLYTFELPQILSLFFMLITGVITYLIVIYYLNYEIMKPFFEIILKNKKKT
jgi:putative peptidoglycan lipid II flippase